jgi:hypothetical protein
MLYTHAAAALVAAIVASTAAWQTQNWRYTGKIAAINAEHAQALADAEKSARATEQKLAANNQRIDHAYQAEKKRRTAADAAAADALRLLQSDLGAADRTADSASVGGADDPRGAIASECAGALVQMESYAGKLAGQTRGLQNYAKDVCASAVK